MKHLKINLNSKLITQNLYSLFIQLIFLTFMPLSGMEGEPTDHVSTVHAALQAERMTDPRVRAVETLETSNYKSAQTLLAQPRVSYTVPSAYAKFSPNGKHVAYFTDEDGNPGLPYLSNKLVLVLASALTGKKQRSILMPERHFRIFNWSSRGNYICANGWNDAQETEDSIIYYTNSLEKLREVKGDIFFSPQETYYCTRDQIIETDSGNIVLKRQKDDAFDSVFHSRPKLIFSPDEQYILILDILKLNPNKGQHTLINLTTLDILKLDSNEEYTHINLTTNEKRIFKIENVGCAAFAPDSSYFVLASPQESGIDIYSLKNFSHQRLSHGDRNGFYAYIGSITISADGKIGLHYHEYLTIIDKNTKKITRYNNPNGPPNLDWNIEEKIEEKNDTNSIIKYYFSPAGTFVLKETKYNLSPGVWRLESKNGSQLFFPDLPDKAEKVNVVVPENGIHPSDMLIICHERTSNVIQVFDVLKFQNLSLKELLAFRVIQSNLKNQSQVCQTAVEILKASRLKFLQDFAQEVEETNAVASAISPAALAAAATTTEAEQTSASSNSGKNLTKRQRRVKEREALENQSKDKKA